MLRFLARAGHHLKTTATTAFFGPQILAFVPALTLGGYWFGGEGLLLFMAIFVPAVMGLVGLFTPVRTPPARASKNVDAVTGLPLKPALLATLDGAFCAEPKHGVRTGALVLEIDEFEAFRATYGAEAAEHVLAQLAERICSTLRQGDVACRLEHSVFAVALAPVRRLDLEAMIQVAARLQQAVGTPIVIGGMRLFLSASVGFCLPRRASERTGQVCVEAAEAALRDAQASGTGAIRAYAAQSPRKRVKRAGLAEEVADALEVGHVRPWFQPQISTDTGAISGMEALARWEHPERGVILPGAFLPAISASGLSKRLGEVILFQSLTALRDWEAAGEHVPNVAVNFSHEELADPSLTDRVRWELDRFDMAPDRLVVEILETVISRSENDTITRNVTRLHDLGCGIDLDDFGTGHASIANIRRFSVGRIKIDRSFVTRIDTDREQQSVLTAILEMAERLEIETLAEGVETVGEHALLAQLGCGYVQGFSIARPMPFAETVDWMRLHRQRMADRPRIAREAG
ncbi:phosphodiesterase [Psychromarinibacter sp. C21-152]|uniref:Phosphodiesterase n=1 Tax=Psychromarinibacter sediminicola TaxID=3033385 RepID=A0AAE3NUY2_9RHOB|nr:phosphodiesterase [Psychromarinibacter sediminicola]MDF0602577.1 phosphodiesterase [Psychromarinibacter sediminicola]